MRPDSITIGIYQFSISWEDIEANRLKIEHVLKSLTNIPGIILLPEMYTTGFSMTPDAINLEKLKDQKSWQQSLSDLFNTCIIGSVISPQAKDVFANEMLATCPGNKEQTYIKRHLFFNEASLPNYIKGNERVCFNIRGINVFPQICYDLRFPVWSRNDMGYDLLFYAANWPASRQKVWETLLPARAIENQSYVVGVNRIGKDGNGIDYVGGSAVYSAKGDCLLQMAKTETFSSLSLSITELDEFRKKFPVLDGRDYFEVDKKKADYS